MNRREAITRTAVLLGGAVSASTIAAVLSGCKTGPIPPSSTFLTPEQESLVAQLCDLILPKTGTPAATEVGVPGFIYTILQECTPAEDRETWTAGLMQLDADAGGLLRLPVDQQTAFLKKLDAEAREAKEPLTPPQAAWRKLKELTLIGYFTSETGASEVLEYIPVPGRFEGCIPLPPGQRTYVI